MSCALTLVLSRSREKTFGAELVGLIKRIVDGPVSGDRSISIAVELRLTCASTRKAVDHVEISSQGSSIVLFYRAELG